MKARVCLLPGDGIGPEVTQAAKAALEKVGTYWDHDFEFVTCPIGGEAIDQTGNPLPEETLATAKQSDAIFLGAIGGPKWDHLAGDQRPEKGLLRLRKELGVFANLRPVKVYPSLHRASPLKDSLLWGVDMMIVRELTGGIYFGHKSRNAFEAQDVCQYTAPEVERIVEVAANIAKKRSARLISVDKANVLETSRLWRDTTTQVISKKFPEIRLQHLLVDAAAMHLLRDPSAFDVVVTSNMFGDILSDEASMLTGSLGMLPSASLGVNGPGLYEPVHGSAPDIAGKGVANPIGAILSAAMLLRHGLELEKEALALEKAVEEVIAAGYGTADLDCGAKTRDTHTLTELILQNLEDSAEGHQYENLAMNISALGC